MSEGSFRLYKDLAWLWPFWGDTEEYRAESELFAKLIKQNADLARGRETAPMRRARFADLRNRS